MMPCRCLVEAKEFVGLLLLAAAAALGVCWALRPHAASTAAHRHLNAPSTTRIVLLYALLLRMALLLAVIATGTTVTLAQYYCQHYYCSTTATE